MAVVVGEGVGEYNTINHITNGEELSELNLQRPAINLENRTDALKTCVDANVLQIGINTPLAASALQPFPVVTAIADFTADTDKIYVINPTLATLAAQLPAPVDAMRITFKDMSGDTSNKVTTIVRAATELIDGVAADLVIDSDFSAVTLVSDGTDWFKI